MKRFKDCLAALVPFYDQEGSNATLIFTTGGEVIPDRRTVKWNLRRLARLYSVDLEAARQNQREFFHYRQGLHLPLSPSLVLVPLKTRNSIGKNDGCHSYLNPAAVREIFESRLGKARSSILLPGEHFIPCHYRVKTVRKRLRDGVTALERHRTTLLAGDTFGAALEPDYKELLDQLIQLFISGFRKESAD